jgi:energy-coupling factor transport system ATP-binding protein
MLDPEGVADITKLIIELKEVYHKTIITITHDLDLAALSDRVIVMKSGEIIGQGSPREVFDHESILASSNLDIPFNLKLYKDIKKDSLLSKNERLVDALWKLNF